MTTDIVLTALDVDGPMTLRQLVEALDGTVPEVNNALYRARSAGRIRVARVIANPRFGARGQVRSVNVYERTPL